MYRLELTTFYPGEKREFKMLTAQKLVGNSWVQLATWGEPFGMEYCYE